VLRDLRHGARLLLKQPGFTTIAVLTLALGIGATAAVFSLIQGVLLTLPPYRQPQRLVLIPSIRTDREPILDPRPWAAAQWREWQQEAASFDAIAAYTWSFNFLVDDEGSESLEGMMVTRDYFRVVGLQPVVGRAFDEAETGVSPPPTIILGYELWQRKFNGDRHIVGKTIRMSRRDTPPTIIGVMPPGIRFLPSPRAAKEWSVRTGYALNRILTMTVTAVQGNWSDFHLRALERISKVPGVQQAAFAWGVPLTGNNWPWTIDIEDHPVTKPTDRPSLPMRAVTPGYFTPLGLKVTAGRDFRSSDVRNAPSVALVNQRLADRYFSNGTAVGKKLWLNGRQQPATEIIGVVTDGREDDITQAAEPEVYLSLWQWTAFSKDLVVRSEGDPRSVAAAVQRELRAVDPTVAVENVRTLEQIRDDSVASRTFATQLLVGFAMVGTALTVVGIYGVLSLSVASRRREIAIRSAVGAQRRDIRRLILGEAFWLIGGGLVAGIAAAMMLARVVRVFLFEVEATDPITLLGAGVLFAVVALLACWVPTRRAASLDPLEALRYD
jgi:hypothetical protein